MHQQAPPAPAVERTEVSVAADRCCGCSECVTACPTGALALMPGTWAVGAAVSRCTGCRQCVPVCPTQAIIVRGPTRSRHRVVLDALHHALATACPDGWRVLTSEPVVPAAADGSPVVPDLAVVRVPLAGLEWLPLDGPPVALVVEVISPSSRNRDLGAKREHYWHVGVPAYWTIEQATGRVAVQWMTRPSWFDVHRHLGFV